MRTNLILSAELAGGVLAQAQLFNGKLLPGQNNGAIDANRLPKTSAQIQPLTGTDTLDRYVGNAGANGGPLTAPSFGVQGPVSVGGNNIGTIKFEYGAFTGHFPGDAADSDGGMVIRGGFTFNNQWKLAPNHELRWLQYYRETGGQARTTVDGDPLYANHALAGVSSLFYDAPVDAFANAQVPTAIDFEAALVCYDAAKPKELHAVGSFLWGYDIDKANKTITDEYALIFTAPLTVTFKNTFATEFGAAGTEDTGWTIDENNAAACFMMIPEPVSSLAFAALCLGLALTARRRWRP